MFILTQAKDFAFRNTLGLSLIATTFILGQFPAIASQKVANQPLLAQVKPGTPGDDTILGTPGNDWLDGGGGNDHIIGQEGSDIFVLYCSNGGVDTIRDFTTNVDFLNVTSSPQIFSQGSKNPNYQPQRKPKLNRINSTDFGVLPDGLTYFIDTGELFCNGQKIGVLVNRPNLGDVDILQAPQNLPKPSN